MRLFVLGSLVGGIQNLPFGSATSIVCLAKRFESYVAQPLLLVLNLPAFDQALDKVFVFNAHWTLFGATFFCSSTQRAQDFN